MSTAHGNVARLARDSAETSHETPVIPLRPGATELPQQVSAEPMDVARRRAEALRLSRDEGLSLREIGERLGVSKDTARRDIQAAERDEAQTADETSQETTRDTDETPPGPRDGDGDTLVLVLDEPLRQALAVLRASRGRPDTPRENVAAARAAIRLMADTVLQAQQHNPS